MSIKKCTMALFLVLTMVLGLLFSLSPVGAAAAADQGAGSPAYPYPLPPLNPNGNILVSVYNGSSWVSAGKIPCDKYLRETSLDLGGLLPAAGPYEVRLSQQGGGGAQVDAAFLGGLAPVAVNGDTGTALGSGVEKLSQRDFDLIDLSKIQDLTFPAGGANDTLQIVARIDSVVIDQTPFQFPLADTFHTITTHSAFYTYTLDSVRGPLSLADTGKAPFFKAYCVPATGHPPGYTYGWVSNDSANLYAIIDFTPADTDNDGVDYTKLFVKNGAEVKQFLDASDNQQYGRALFTYTGKVNYEHEVFELKVPFAAMGITYRPGLKLPLAFAAFGTAGAGSVCYTGLAYGSTNNQPVYENVYDKLGSDWNYYTYGQLLDSHANPVGSPILFGGKETQSYPVADAYDQASGQFMLVGCDGTGATVTGDVYMTGSGGVTQTGTITNMDPNGGFGLAYDSTGNRFLIAYETSGGAVEGQFLDASGQPISGGSFPIATSANDSYPILVAYDPTGDQYLVSWTGTDYNQYARFFDAADGSPTSSQYSLTSSVGYAGGASTSLAFDGRDQEFLLVWPTGNGTYELDAQFFHAADGKPVAAASTVASGDYYYSSSCSCGNNGFLISYNDAGTVYGRFMDAQGNLQAAPFEIGPDAFMGLSVAHNSSYDSYVLSYGAYTNATDKLVQELTLDEYAYGLTAGGSPHNTVVDMVDGPGVDGAPSPGTNGVGASYDVTPYATYSSSNTAVAKVNASGVVSGVSAGTAVITAVYGYFTDSAVVTVSDAYLSNLSISSGTLTPSFAETTYSYTDSVANSVGSVTVTPTTDDPNATVTVNGTPVTSGHASGAINLSVGSNSIDVVVTAPDGATSHAYTLTVTRESGSGSSGSSGGGVAPSLAITTTSLPAATVGQQYSQTITTNNEGTAPYTFSVSSGNLPPGLILDTSTGTISGTPTTAGTYTFTVTVQDANNNTANESYNLTIMISPSLGGTVALGTDVSLNVPAGALQGNANVEVTIQSESSPPTAPEGYTIIGAYEFTVNGQDHYTFNSPVTLTFTFDPAKVAKGTTPAVYYYNGTKWVLLTGKVDWTNDTITVVVDHFTQYAVMVSKPAPSVAPKVTLKDITGSWARADIEKLVSLGAITGYPDGTFRPNNDITRAEFTTVLVKALKLAPKTGPVFADTRGTWAQGYISTAAAYGIVKGYNASHFGPNDLVTREQMAAMVVRADKLALVSGPLPFTDAAQIDPWAREYVETAAKDGIIHGYPDDTFRPLAYATRAEAVAVIAGLLK